MKVAPFQLAKSVVMGAGYVSSVVDLQQVWTFSIQANWTGAPLGELKLQASNDVVPQTVDRDSPYFQPTNWVNVANTVNSTAAIVGTTTFMINIDSPQYRWIRFVYSAATASGALTLNCLTKGY